MKKKTTLTVKEYKEILKKPHKYHATRTEYNGRLYDSKAEALRAKQLDDKKNMGLIIDWTPQVTFLLGIPENKMRVDFVVWNLDGTAHVEEVKGAWTSKFRRDYKLWKRYGPIPLHVLKRKGNSWITEGLTPRLLKREDNKND